VAETLSKGFWVAEKESDRFGVLRYLVRPFRRIRAVRGTFLRALRRHGLASG